MRKGQYNHKFVNDIVSFIVLNMLNIFQEMICISCRLVFKSCDVICIYVIYTFSSKVK